MWGVVFDVGIRLVEKVYDRVAKKNDAKAQRRQGRLETLAAQATRDRLQFEKFNENLARANAIRDDAARTKELPDDGYNRD